jgi:phosphoethanolamine N-methyltransferase
MPTDNFNDQTTTGFGSQLDATQYQPESIEKYEAVYGRNFVGPGGLDSARACIARLGLRPGMRVLDVGCGLGGSAFCMAREHGAQVHGIDLSANMIEGARRRLHAEGLQGLVTLERQDVMTLDPARHGARYQVIYSRDAFLHIHDKARLLALLRELLAPGGLLFFTDYCRGEGAPSEAFAAYIAERQYDLRTVREYQQLLERAGFSQVRVIDQTAEFGAILRDEFSRIQDDAAHAAIRRSWSDKIARARTGEQGWCWGEGRRAAGAGP